MKPFEYTHFSDDLMTTELQNRNRISFNIKILYSVLARGIDNGKTIIQQYNVALHYNTRLLADTSYYYYIPYTPSISGILERISPPRPHVDDILVSHTEIRSVIRDRWGLLEVFSLKMFCADNRVIHRYLHIAYRADIILCDCNENGNTRGISSTGYWTLQSDKTIS